MTSGNEIDSARAGAGSAVSVTASSPASGMRRWSRRSGLASVLAALSVVGFAAAIVAPTGMAVAEQPAAEAETSFSLAVQDTQDLTVTARGATIEPVERGVFDVYVKPKPKPEPQVASTPATPAAPAPQPFYSGGGAPAEWMAAAGIASSDWGYVDYIVSHESGWNPNATNASSGACGLVQALPCSKVPGNGYDPVDNLRWATGYATGRYGSWAGAYAFWTSNNWW